MKKTQKTAVFARKTWKRLALFFCRWLRMLRRFFGQKRLVQVVFFSPQHLPGWCAFAYGPMGGPHLCYISPPRHQRNIAQHYRWWIFFGELWWPWWFLWSNLSTLAGQRRSESRLVTRKVLLNGKLVTFGEFLFGPGKFSNNYYCLCFFFSIIIKHL